MQTTRVPGLALSERKLSSAEKAAIILLSMDRSEANEIIKQFDESELRQLASTVATLGRIPSSSIDWAIDEFIAMLQSASPIEGSVDQAENLLAGALPPEKLSELVADIRGDTAQKVWDLLPSIRPNVIAEFIELEHPQVAAFMVARLQPELVAEIMELLSDQLRLNIVQRIITLLASKRAAIRIMEEVILTDLIEKATSDDRSRSYRNIAAALNQMTPDKARNLLTDLSEVQPVDARNIRVLLFSFSDIGALNPPDRVKLFERVPTDLIPIAIAGADPELGLMILESLSNRTRRLVEGELSVLAREPSPEAKAAQRAIANFALKMAQNGELVLTSHSD